MGKGRQFKVSMGPWGGAPKPSDGSNYSIISLEKEKMIQGF